MNTYTKVGEYTVTGVVDWIGGLHWTGMDWTGLDWTVQYTI